ncbi:MAG: MFS transporter [Candidatus Nanopelagicales bacterium]|nr:MFS transporter [Candidatus Nanopelagicales bacterium]
MELQRTPITWAIYACGSAWASFLYLAGPLAPVLAEALGVRRAWAGLMGTAMAAGAVVAATLTPAVIRRRGRDGTMRLGLGLLASTLVLLAVVPAAIGGAAGFVAALVLVFVIAMGGGGQLNAAFARLADAHPAHSATVITEANAAAAWVGLTSPLLLGLALAAGLPWWVGVLVCLGAAVGALGWLVLAGRAAPAGSAPDREGDLVLVVADEGFVMADQPTPPAGRHRLPRVFAIAMIALFSAVATEFSINFWGSPLIQEQTGASASTATTAMSALVLGIAVGRTVGPRLIARFGPHAMLLAGFGLTLVAFAVLWLAGTVVLSVVGLFAAGLGIAMLYPLVIDRGILLSDGEPDLAMSRASIVLGVAVATAPFLLGALGSVMSVRMAMLLVPVLVVVGVVGVLGSRPRVPVRA